MHSQYQLHAGKELIFSHLHPLSLVRCWLGALSPQGSSRQESPLDVTDENTYFDQSLRYLGCNWVMYYQVGTLIKVLDIWDVSR